MKDVEKDINFIQKCRVLKTDNKDYPYNVQIWNSVDGGKKFYYTGNGKFIKNKQELNVYLKELNDAGIKLENTEERKNTIYENKCDEKDIKVEIIKNNTNKKKVLTIKQIGIDNWYRPVYTDEKGIIYKDINLGRGVIALCTASSNDFYGEPDTTIKPDITINIVKEFKSKNRGAR